MTPRIQQWAASPEVARDLGDARAFLLMDAATGDVLAEHEADRPLAIASCQKLFTAAAALAVLGPARTFTTTADVGMDGRIYLRGGGDPRISPENLARLAAQVAIAAGPRQLGDPLDVLVDESLFPPFTSAQGWQADYLPLEIQPVVPLVLPEYFGDEPGRAVGEAFAGALRSHGLRAEFVGQDAAPGGSRTIASVESQSVMELVVHMLHGSHNLTAEVLHRQVALAMGESPDWRGAQRASLQALASLGLGVDAAVVPDGSGLSPEGRWTLVALGDLLRLLACGAAHTHLQAIYPGGGMAQLGLTGSLSAINGWFTDPAYRPVRGRVWAKSGTLVGTRALAGIALPPSGEARVFAVVAAGAPSEADARRRLEQFAAIAAGLDPAGD